MNEIVKQSALAFKLWRKTALSHRVLLLKSLALKLEQKADTFARLMAEEMGKPVSEGRAEIKKCAFNCNYFAEQGPQMLADEKRESDAQSSFVRHEPLGPILAIMPWNFPFWQVFRMAAPALIAGNSIILKHSESTRRCAAAIAELFREVNAPLGLLQVIDATHEQIPQIIGDKRIRAVTLTGSNRAGEIVGELAGRFVKKIVLELGGSDPFIVFDDVDTKDVAQKAALARCQNSGQSCIAAKRFIIQANIFDEFLAYFVEAMQNLVAGDPLSEKTQVGPLANKNQQALLEAQVNDAKAKGAKVWCGGSTTSGPPYYYPPTVLSDITNDMRVYHEEVFGPVACVYAFEQADEAVRLANDTSFGLASSIWTKDESRALALVDDLEQGLVFINAIPRSDPRLPFGGVKASGHGRELGREGLMEFVNQKTVWLA